MEQLGSAGSFASNLFYVITSPTALERVSPKISKTTKPLRIRIALATSVSQTPCSVVSLTTTDAVFAK